MVGSHRGKHFDSGAGDGDFSSPCIIDRETARTYWWSFARCTFVKSLRIPGFIASVFCWLGGWAFAGEKQPDSWEDLARRSDVHIALKTNGRDTITVEIANHSGEPFTAEIPAGLVCELADRTGKVITLRAAPITIEAGGSAETIIPAAALSLKNAATAQGCIATSDTVQKLAPLLAWLANRPDVPRSTTQIAVLSLMEDISFAQWQNFLLAAQPKPDTAAHPTPAEVAQAVDALAILREVAPGNSSALAGDAELKLRALRNPLSRAKAMQLYGITLPSEDAAAAVAPDIGQLLHRVPGDNCPVCRARTRMQQPPDAP